MDERQPVARYKPLGKRLKSMRTQARESLAEASGAVEIDVKQLASYELGHSRPDEEILLLLISHFGASDDEAVNLWELAGYGLTKLPDDFTSRKISPAPDNRVLFTDIVDVIVNNYGVVMNFMQSAGPQTKPVTVARVGMSREHAKSVLQILQVTLSQTERGAPKLPKKMIAPDSTFPDDSHKN